MSQKRIRSVSLQKQSHDVDVHHLQLENEDAPFYEFSSTPESNVSKSSDFTDILKQWKRINGMKGKNLDLKQEGDRMRKESQMNKTESDCSGFRTCRCIKRVIFIMNFYDEWCHKHDTKKIYKGLSLNDIIEGLPSFDIIQLWNDFLHAKYCHFIQTENNTIWESIQVWDYIESKLGARNIAKCDKFKRNNRNRSISGTESQRKSLFYGFTEAEEIIAIQFCDVIWEFLFHSKMLFKNEFANKILYDPHKIEREIIAKNANEENADRNIPKVRRGSHQQRTSMTSTIAKRMLQRLEKQKVKQMDVTQNNDDNKHEFKYNESDKEAFEEYIHLRNEIINVNMTAADNKDIIKSKFVSNISDEDSTSFGVSFVYWKGYKSWRTYIKTPTFSSLKEEMLNNPYYRITIYQWKDTLIKSIKLNASNMGRKWVTKNAGILNKRYGIRPRVPISVAHIMCILFYVNYRDLQFEFKWNACMKWNKSETSNVVKERNKNIGNWYKLFTECITLYGDITNKQQTFYHGLNKRILFDAFKPNFKCMISTTSSLSVAQSIIANNKGIIIKLQQKRSLPYGYLDVGWCSDFQNESEKIFSFSQLDIVDIYQNQPTFQSNTVYVKSLILFQSIIKGQYFEHTLHEKHRYQKVIIAMIENWITQNDGDEQQDEKSNEIELKKRINIMIPTYLQQLFDSFVNKQQTLYVIRSQYDHLCYDLKAFLIDFDDDSNYEFGGFLNKLKERNNNRLKLLLMKEFRWDFSGDIMTQFKNLPTNNTIKGKYFHAGNDVVLYPRLRRSDRDFPDKSMMFCYVEDMPSNYNRIYMQWELFCKETNYHSSHTQYLKKDEFAGYTVSDTNDLCCLEKFTFEIAVHILDIDKK